MMEMKVFIEQIESQEKEIIIRCNGVDEEVNYLKSVIESLGQRLIGQEDGETVFLKPGEIYYFEYVDYYVFAYTRNKCYKISYSLEKLEKMYQYLGYMRCSKSMIINMNFVDRLKSTMGNRIVATLENGEKVMISRHFAKLLRAYLKSE